MSTLSDRQRNRYSRSLLMDWFDEKDQERLLESRVLVIGAGGLGSSILLYLASVGVGTIGIHDRGEVRLSNLQRQVLYTTDDVGKPKVESAARRISRINPEISVETDATEFDPETAVSVVENYDIVIDGLDNIRGRLLANDAARLAGIPFVHGAVYGYEGQTMVFRPSGPCYRCLIPELPESPTVPEDEPIGVFPPMPGMIGCVQAAEAIKLVLETGTTLDDRMLRIDVLDIDWAFTPVNSRPDCPVCGPEGITDIFEENYQSKCRIERTR